jgi:hypothetical protein
LSDSNLPNKPKTLFGTALSNMLVRRGDPGFVEKSPDAAQPFQWVFGAAKSIRRLTPVAPAVGVEQTPQVAIKTDGITVSVPAVEDVALERAAEAPSPLDSAANHQQAMAPDPAALESTVAHVPPQDADSAPEIAEALADDSAEDTSAEDATGDRSANARSTLEFASNPQLELTPQPDALESTDAQVPSQDEDTAAEIEVVRAEASAAAKKDAPLFLFPLRRLADAPGAESCVLASVLLSDALLTFIASRCKVCRRAGFTDATCYSYPGDEDAVVHSKAIDYPYLDLRVDGTGFALQCDVNEDTEPEYRSEHFDLDSLRSVLENPDCLASYEALGWYGGVILSTDGDSPSEVISMMRTTFPELSKLEDEAVSLRNSAGDPVDDAE